MENDEVAEATRKPGFDRYARMASISILAGIGVWCLIGLVDLFLEKHGPIFEAVRNVVAVAAFGLAYLVAPIFGVLACVGLLRSGRLSGQANRLYLLHQAGGRFGWAAILFALTGSVAVVVVHTLGAHVKQSTQTYVLYVWPTFPPLLAVVLGVVSLWCLAQVRRPSLRWALPLLAIGIGFLAAAGPWLHRGYTWAVCSPASDPPPHHFQQVAYARERETFSGSSKMLEQTVVVPTLDSPMPAGRNVIWCSSFQLAWNEVRDNVIGAPLEMPEAAELAARLNTAQQSASDVDAGCVYVAGGRIKEGIIDRIKREMAVRFPSHTLPDFNDYLPMGPDHILSYSFLRANVRFTHPFREIGEGLTFIDSKGNTSQIAGFGLWEGYRPEYEKICEQVEVLYHHRPDGENAPSEMEEYVIDLCRFSRPYEVMVAVVEPNDSLAQTLDYIQSRVQQFKGRSDHERQSRFEVLDVLRVPEMVWRVDHRFKELIGKTVANSNPPMPIVEAMQTIEFQLDRCGATVESEAMIRIAGVATPRRFLFNRPFLVCMKQRDAEHPFFVMWVDNAELLTPK